MRGVVSKVGNDYLSLLCGGVFHVAIGRQDIHEGFRPAGRGTWRGSSGDRWTPSFSPAPALCVLQRCCEP